MRTPIIAGNWKMNKTYEEALSFVEAVKEKVPSRDQVETVICAPALFLKGMKDNSKESDVKIGAQTMHYEKSGAFTGEISPASLADIGIDYVIIGHSERREMFNETDETVNKKLHAAFHYGIIPIMCCGETLAEKENNQTVKVVERQVQKGFEGLPKEQAARTVIAYEPIWAIGTGKSSSAEDANDTCMSIRKVLTELYDHETAEKVRILYGGSLKPENIENFIKMEHIDGGLVGGASLKPEAFIQLTEVGKNE